MGNIFKSYILVTVVKKAGIEIKKAEMEMKRERVAAEERMSDGRVASEERIAQIQADEHVGYERGNFGKDVKAKRSIFNEDELSYIERAIDLYAMDLVLSVHFSQ